MFKAKLFPYRLSNIYFKRYGILPDRHFDKLREKYGTDAALDIVDGNMKKTIEINIEEARKKEEEEQRKLDLECPFW